MLPLRLGLNVISHITALSCMGFKLTCSSPENKTFCTRLAFCGAVLNDLVWQTRFVWWNLGSWWTLHVITVLRRPEWKLLLVILCCYWLDCTFEDCELVIVLHRPETGLLTKPLLGTLIFQMWNSLFHDLGKLFGLLCFPRKGKHCPVANSWGKSSGGSSLPHFE